ncbi:MAG: FkbM family methyltransferase [Alphaproteobacteria bacterium]|nr:FkbM family methyltransferase [Alphaproteobacteria bacterium]
MNKPASADPAQAIAVRQGRYGHVMYTRSDMYIGKSLELYGEYSESEIQLFKLLVKPGNIVVEAGANMGGLTLPLARLVGPKGRVFAFEPQRAMFYLLSGTLALNAIMNVDAFRACAGKAGGVAGIPVHGYALSGNLGNVSMKEANAPGTEPVPVIAIDSLKLNKLHFIKIDVEGAEAEVLEGARETIARCRPLIYLENNEREKSPNLIGLIDSLGYRAWWHLAPLFNPDNFNKNPQNAFGNTITINLLCIPKEMKTEIKGLRPVSGPDDWWKPEETGTSASR